MTSTAYLRDVLDAYTRGAPYYLCWVLGAMFAVLGHKRPGMRGHAERAWRRTRLILIASIIALSPPWILEAGKAYVSAIEVSSEQDWEYTNKVRLAFWWAVNYLPGTAVILLFYCTMSDHTGSQGRLEKSRPFIVSGLGWTLIGLGSAGLLFTVWMLLYLVDNRQPLDRVTPVLAVYSLGAAFQIGIAIGLLHGANWARLLFLWLYPISLTASLLLRRFSLGHAMSALIFVACAIVLTRPSSMEFFTPTLRRKSNP